MWVSQENMAKPIPNKARLFLDSLFCNMKSGRCLMAMHRNSMMGCHLFVSRWRSFRLESTEPWPSKLDINMVGHIIHLHTLSACQPSISSQMPHPVWWQGPGFGRWPSSIFWGVASSNETWRADACCKISHIVRWSSQCFLFFSREVCHSRHKACVTSHNNFPIQIHVSWISPWSLLRLRRSEGSPWVTHPSSRQATDAVTPREPSSTQAMAGRIPAGPKGGEANPKVTIPAGLRRQNKVGSYHVVLNGINMCNLH